MQKIMFNDKYRLTQSVLEGRKTQTRRIIKGVDNLSFDNFGIENNGTQYVSFMRHLNYMFGEDNCFKHIAFPYQVGEEVAIAQSYKDIFEEDSAQGILGHPTVLERNACNTAGWKNKMFVKAGSMKHHIRITNVRVERLQDISYEDCLAEGIEVCGYDYEGREIYSFRYGDKWYEGYRTEKEAYAGLIDKVGKKGTWQSNPWVFAYDFELID